MNRELCIQAKAHQLFQTCPKEWSGEVISVLATWSLSYSLIHLIIPSGYSFIHLINSLTCRVANSNTYHEYSWLGRAWGELECEVWGDLCPAMGMSSPRHWLILLCQNMASMLLCLCSLQANQRPPSILKCWELIQSFKIICGPNLTLTFWDGHLQ